MEQNAEVLGDVALFEAGFLDEFGDDEGLAHEGAEQFEPGGIGENGKEAGGFVHLGIGHGFFLCLHITE
ncbi:hypothetical protein BH09VER1_BH09VER1_06580 [soil metagenome]